MIKENKRLKKMGLKYENESGENIKDNQISFLLDANYDLDGTKVGLNTEKVIYGDEIIGKFLELLSKNRRCLMNARGA